MGRPLAEIVEDIVFCLEPLKPGAGDPRPEILKRIGWVQEYGPELARRRNMAVIRKHALDAATALAALQRQLPSFGPWQFLQWEALLRVLANVEDRHANIKVIHRFCAFQAIALVRQFSKEPAVSTDDEDTHSIAQLIFEAVTGKPRSKAGLLRALKEMMAWDKETSKAGKLPAVPTA